MNKPNMISVRGLKKSFGEQTVLRDIHLEIARGEVVALIGPSGSGKSTLLRCLNLLATPDHGVIKIELDETMWSPASAMLSTAAVSAACPLASSSAPVRASSATTWLNGSETYMTPSATMGEA